MLPVLILVFACAAACATSRNQRPVRTVPRPTPPAPAQRADTTTRTLPYPASVVTAAPPPADGGLREGRALWVSRFDFASEADIVRIMQHASRAGMNTIYFQVRAAADAFYQSSIEPCAARLCGRMGGALPYDPLQVAVREAHAHGMQLHAWLNALTGAPAGAAESCRTLSASPGNAPQHILLTNPEFAMRDRRGRPLPCPNGEEYVWLSPGFPAVRTRLATVAADIVRRYDVDGIHLDRVRYPGAAWSFDLPSLAAFGSDPTQHAEEWAEFRRDLVDLTVRETHDSIVKVKPSTVYSAAVWAVESDRWNWNSSDGRKQYMQDPREWAATGYIDVVVPMTYFRISAQYCAYADWACLLDDHIDGVSRRTGRHMYIGIDAQFGAVEAQRQIELGRSRGVNGFAIFSYAAAARSGLLDSLGSRLFNVPSVAPSLPWKPARTRAPSPLPY